MLRIHLTPADLGRITVAGADPMWELVTSARALAIGGAAPAGWRNQVVPRLGPAVRPLLDLVRQPENIPTFLIPLREPGFAAGFAAVFSAPTAELRAELAAHADATAGRGTPGWTRHLTAGDRLGRTLLDGALRAYHEAGLAPCWDLVTARASADRAMRAQLLLDGGLDLLLSTLHPDIRWDPPVLHVAQNGGAGDDHWLRGRGLVLVPWYFGSTPVLVAPTDCRPFLAYPVRRDVMTPRPGDELIALLGRTRAAVLAALGDGATTTQLAHRVGVSLASASQHAAVLRNAGLVTTTRAGGAVLHTRTPLGPVPK
jgi:hypothetical protein